ncbi:MAG: hypothetical protein ACOC5D_06205 [Thermoplasmatota archaeon]
MEEAKFFYSKMEETKRKGKEFTYNLSAFLTAARSILQYLRDEVKGGPNQSWYDNYVSSNKILQFFKDRRDFNIHEEPINPKEKVRITETLSLSESLTIKKDDEIIHHSDELSNSEAEKNNQKSQKAEVEHSYIFKEWGGKEPVLELCKKYLKELENMLEEGVKKGIISSKVI